MTGEPDWLVTDDEVRARLRDWARTRELRYELSGLLPPVSSHLRKGRTTGWQTAGVLYGRGGATITRRSRRRPGRFSENLCSGTLPGGVEGTVAQHTYVGRHGDDWVAVCDTVVLARVPEAARVTRGLIGTPRETRPRTLVVTKHEYGDTVKEVVLAEALEGRFVWEVDVDEDTAALQRAFAADVVAALDAVPRGARVCVRDGWLTVELREFDHSPEDLDSLCRAASALAAELRRAASTLPALSPEDGALPPPRETRYRRWLDAGAARVEWPEPPADVKTAIELYREAAREDRHAARRGRRGFATIFLLVMVVCGIALVPLVLALGPALSAAAVGVVVVVALLLAARSGAAVREQDVAERAQAWGRDAFFREYARARGLRLEDEEELRRRMPPLPLAGHPERSAYGALTGKVEGRIVTWRDPTDPETFDRALDLALVAAVDGDRRAARDGFDAIRAGDWLVVVHELGSGARTMAGLDALSAEAARLGAPA